MSLASYGYWLLGTAFILGLIFSWVALATKNMPGDLGELGPSLSRSLLAFLISCASVTTVGMVLVAIHPLVVASTFYFWCLIVGSLAFWGWVFYVARFTIFKGGWMFCFAIRSFGKMLSDSEARQLLEEEHRRFQPSRTTMRKIYSLISLISLFGCGMSLFSLYQQYHN